MITKAVLLAAGKGTRLGAITADFPKALLEVGGIPLIAHMLGGLKRAGVEEVTIVTGHFGELVEAELGSGSQEGLRLRYVRQETLDGTARAIALARPNLGGDPFFYGLADVLVRPENYRRVIAAARFAGAVIAVNDMDDPYRGAAVVVDEAMRVLKLVEKPPQGTSTTRWNHAGFGVLPAAIWAEIERLQPSARGEYELPQAIAALIESGVEVRAVPVDGPWFDAGTPGDLEAARAAWAGVRR